MCNKKTCKFNHTQPKFILRGGDTFMPFISPQSIERSHNAFIGWQQIFRSWLRVSENVKTYCKN